MDIGIYQNGEYVNTFYDAADSAEELTDFLCRFCEDEGFFIGPVEQAELSDCAEELLSGNQISLCGFELCSVSDSGR